ncbi:transaldolase [Bdellovibrionota bacterium FG-2]
MTTNKKLNIHVYADGAYRDEMLKRYRDGSVKGFTTNPSLLVKAGVKDYAGFAKEILAEIKTLPISFEVFSDDFSQMEREAGIISAWAANVNVKIPITNTKGESSIPLIKRLLEKKMKLNVTAVFTQRQIDALSEALRPQDDVVVSIFAGRIADTGVDPVPMMKRAVEDYRSLTGSKILWASPREALNVYQANECGCHIITATDDIISKLKIAGKDLEEFSLDTVKMFLADSQKAGFKL